jgi:hypothetical protein
MLHRMPTRRNNLKLSQRGQLGNLHHGEIRAPILHQPDGFGDIRGQDLNPCSARAIEAGSHGRQSQRVQGHHGRSDGQRPHLRAAQGLHRGGQGIQTHDDLVPLGQDGAAGIGWCHPAPGTIEQRGAKLFLDLREVACQARLRHPEHAASLHPRAVLGDGDNDPVVTPTQCMPFAQENYAAAR